MQETSILVKVKPNSRKTFVQECDGKYIVNLKSKPENGKANEELIRVLAKHFNCAVKIVRGKCSPKKIIKLS